MTLYPRNFVALLDGRNGGVATVASLSIQIGIRFSAQTRDVQIQTLYAKKIHTEHRIHFEDFWHIQKCIDEGYIFAGREPQYLEFIFVEFDQKIKHYLLVLKTARYGQEVWVQTFHRTDETHLRSMLKRRKLLRRHL